MTRAFRRLLAKVLIAAVLFLQLAVAAYACPGLSTHTDASPSAAMADEMQMDAGCAMVDEAQPNLCSQHCQQNSRVLDQSPPAAVPVAVLPLLAVVDSQLEPLCAKSEAPREFLARATAPPLSIRFCVFRI